MARNPAASTSALLTYYGFELNNRLLDQVVCNWLSKYPPKWVVGAVIEAVYQGRYKVASVERILFLWYLRGQSRHHFDYEFADIVCSKVFATIPAHSLAIEDAKKAPNIRLFPRQRTLKKLSSSPRRFNLTVA